jgi:rhodanese-related sulfurtransferase
MKQLRPEELKSWIDSQREIQVLDVRERWEYDIVRLKNAILRPLGFLHLNPPELNKDIPVVVYCHHGVRSLRGCTVMEQLGFKEVYNLAGGIELYAAAVDPDLPAY